MWNIINKTPFKIGKGFIQDDKTGEPVWLTAIKATFDINPDGELTLSEEQMAVFSEPQFKATPYKSSMLYDSDLIPEKQKVDLILNAVAHVPNAQWADELTVGVAMGKWRKDLKVIGDRIWQRVLGFHVQSYREKFKAMEICYENAYGGGNFRENTEMPEYDIRNPIGKGYIKRWQDMNRQKLPNIELPGFPLKKRIKKNKVAGFGAIPPFWQSRNKYAGTTNGNTPPNQPRPKDFNPLYYQCAPEDQQFDTIEEGEAVALHKLTPSEKLIFWLPRVTINCQTQTDEEQIKSQAKLQTIIIEPEFPRLIMIWQTSLPCEGKQESIESTKVEYELKL